MTLEMFNYFKFQFCIIKQFSNFQVDRGTEFYNKNLHAVLEALDIHMYSTFTDKKASIVERVQRTIRGRIFKLFTAQNNHKWIDALPKLIDSYNKSKHSSIKMKPADVKPEHTQILLNRLYGNKKYKETVKREKYRNKLLKVGDFVRVVKDKKFYPKESDQRWTNELYKIRIVERKNFPITYLLSKDNGESLPRSFYREELKKVVKSN